jgi:hypothetical protein
VLQWASQNPNTPLMRWAGTITASEIQTSVVALAIARAQVEHTYQGTERNLWLQSLHLLEYDITAHAGPPLPIDNQVATEWVGLRYASLQSRDDAGVAKKTSQDVRFVIATAMAHKLVLVDAVTEPYQGQLRAWGYKVWVPT